jgi:hypothetical protein
MVGRNDEEEQDEEDPDPVEIPSSPRIFVKTSDAVL